MLSKGSVHPAMLSEPQPLLAKEGLRCIKHGVVSPARREIEITFAKQPLRGMDGSISLIQ